MSSTTGAHSLLLYFSKFARIIVPEVPKKYPSQSFSQTLSPDKITNTMKSTLLLLAAGLFLLASCKPPEPPKVTATDTGKSGPGGQTIKGGDVTMSFSADGKPLTFTPESRAKDIVNWLDKVTPYEPPNPADTSVEQPKAPALPAK
jgi:hypothetical protein